MKRFTISNTHSGHCLGVYEAEDTQGALDAMARDAGYQDYAECQRTAPAQDGEIEVKEIEEGADETQVS